MYQSEGVDDNLGSVCVYLLSPIRTYDAAATFVSVEVLVAGGEDFEVADYIGARGTLHATSFPNPLDKKVPKPETAQCSRVPAEVFQKPFESFLPVSHYKDQHLFISDPPTAPHILARRPVFFGSYTGATNTWNNLTRPARWVNTTPGASIWNWLDYIVLSFRGWRGGYRVHAFPTINANSSPTGGSTVASLNWASYKRSIGDTEGSICHDHMTSLSFEFPYTERSLYIQTAAYNTLWSDAPVLPGSDYRFDQLGGGASTNAALRFLESAADDFQLIDWMAPFLTPAA